MKSPSHLHRLFAFVAAALLLSTQAIAATTVRIEWQRNGVTYATETVSSSGASTQSGAAPAFTAAVSGQARITVLSGVALVSAPDANPTATEQNSTRLQTCSDPYFVTVIPGQKLAILESANASSCASGGGGGGGDASAANQSAQITQETAINTVLGAQADSAAASDTATASHISLVKRLLQKLTTINTTLGSPFQAGGALGAGENHVGEVGGNQLTVQVAQTVTASSAYTTGNAVGGKMTLANALRTSGKSGLLQSVVVNSKSAQTAQIDVFLFSADPSASTCTDKTAFALNSADFDKVLGVVHVSDWTAGNTASVGQAQNIAMPYAAASGTSLYACAVVRGTPTFASTSDVSLGFRVIRD